MRFNVHFTIKGPAGTAEAPNVTNPLEARSLDALLHQLSGKLPRSEMLGYETVGVRVELVAEDPGKEFDPCTGQPLDGKVEPCCECGNDYPRADLVVRGDIYCPKCRPDGRPKPEADALGKG